MMRIIRFFTPSEWGWVITGIEMGWKAFTLIMGHLLAFPILSSSHWYTAIMSLILWMLWYVWFTQPKAVDGVMNSITGALEKPANSLRGKVWPLTNLFSWKVVLGILILKFLGLLYLLSVFALFFSTYEGKKETYKPGRLFLTLGLCNLLSSEKLMTKTLGSTDVWYHQIPVGWLFSFGLAIILLLFWIFVLQTPEYRQHAKEVMREKGKPYGFFTLLIEDFMPTPTEGVCPACKHKNLLDDKGVWESCTGCGARNPKTDWPCPQCNTVNKAANKFCRKCGHKNPHTGSETSRNRTEQQADTTAVARTCPDCRSPVSPQANFCGECAIELRESNPTPSARQITSASSDNPTTGDKLLDLM